MENKIPHLIYKFEKIKKMGYVKSDYRGSLAVGRTIEKLLDLNENRIEMPDYFGIEIKTKTANKYSDITLFSCSPFGYKPYEIDRLRKRYGYPDREFKQFKVLNSETNCREKCRIGLFYKFKTEINDKNNVLLLNVFNYKDELIDNSTFWPLFILEDRIINKCKYLAYIRADKKIIDDIQYFKYTSMVILKLKGYETFLKLLNDGTIKIKFKAGIYKNEEKLGLTYDHGTSFAIDEKDLLKLFSVIYNSKLID